ncbi:hypothetical protein [Desulfotomaculum nigrificans]|uniref:hypothetical protein n=1 Tax=Desulfotomaculum nigrificans TaxID=1565 RepID=UPI0004819300|nr:hypothetical protein [Desulfotomaculum nigrificans]
MGEVVITCCIYTNILVTVEKIISSNIPSIICEEGIEKLGSIGGYQNKKNYTKFSTRPDDTDLDMDEFSQAVVVAVQNMLLVAWAKRIGSVLLSLGCIPLVTPVRGIPW